MDTNNPVISLCIAGTEAEFQGRAQQACALYQQAWTLAQDDYEACIAAHYVARCQTDPRTKLRWNQLALDKAQAAADDRVEAFYPSLFLNMGQSYALLGDADEAQRYYDLAAAMGFPHQMELKGEKLVVF
ncbi:MAG: hypothetical protein WAZ19_04485 [Anaerolineae bacterium]